MIYEEMSTQIKRIESVYGRDYHDELMTIFWNEFKYHQVNRFKYLIDQVLSASKSFPTINEFKKIDSELRGKQYEKEKQNTSKEISQTFKEDPLNELLGLTSRAKQSAKCKYCNDSGCITATKKSTQSEYTFKCLCSKGQDLDIHYPIWNKQLRTMFDLLPIMDDSKIEDEFTIKIRKEWLKKDGLLECRYKDNHRNKTYIKNITDT